MSCSYTSPQNGKAKRIIRFINNVIRTLLIQASLLRRYWAERLDTATYLLNRLPIKAIQVVCLHITLFGFAPSYEHLQVFGCACYPNTAATAPHNLAPRSTRCVFLGYSSDHKGYRCLDLSTNHLIVSRHVVFDEDSFPLAASPIPLTKIFFVSLAPQSPPLEPDSPLQVLWHPANQPRRSLRDSSHLCLPFPLRQSRRDFCPERHRLLCHVRPRPLLLHRLRSRMAHHPVSCWPR
jgi:hypothetical protein